jgi:hypothetical protein
MDTVCPKSTRIVTAKFKILQPSSCNGDAPWHDTILSKDGIDFFKEVGEVAVSKNILQLHVRDTFEPQETTNHKLKQGQKRAPWKP